VLVSTPNSLFNNFFERPLLAFSGIGLLSVASGLRRAYNYLRVKDSGLDAYARLNTSPEPLYLKELFDVTLVSFKIKYYFKLIMIINRKRRVRL
jgi:hypothetical protein